MDFIDYVDLSKTRLTDQHRRDEIFVAIIEATAEVLNDYQQNIIDISSDLLSVDNSEGFNLDLIGKIVNQPRGLVNFFTKDYFGFDGGSNLGFDDGEYYSLLATNIGQARVLSDDEYREIIKARIVKNNSSPTVNTLLEVINLISGNTDTICSVTTHGVINLTVDDTSGLTRYFLNKRNEINSIIPRPLGYRIVVEYV